MKIARPPFIISIVISVLSLVGVGIVYRYLPAIIPIHWNALGEVDSTGPRWVIFLLAAMPLGMIGLLAVTPRLDPRGEAYEKHGKAYQVVILLITLLLVMVTWVSLAVALGWPLRVEIIVPVAVGVVFLVLGNFLPQVRNNFSFGVRTPWALSNEVCWRKTQRFGGYVFVGLGLMFVALPFLPLPAIPKWIGGTVLMFAGIFSMFLYSWLVWRKEQGVKADQ